MSLKRYQSGHIYLELIILVMLSSGAYLFWTASEASSLLMRHEDHASEVLDAIARAQHDFHQALAQKGIDRFGTLEELLGISGRSTDYLELGTDLRRLLETARPMDAIIADEHYCFIVYLVDQDGYPLDRNKGDDKIKPGFWIAYAWPRHYGKNSRRVFVLDSFGVMRSWENQMNGSHAYEGIEGIPPAHLAPPPEKQAYPLMKKPQGIQRVNQWLLE